MFEMKNMVAKKETFAAKLKKKKKSNNVDCGIGKESQV